MAKNKKPKKAYTPRKLYYPRLLVSMICFKPIEDAIEAVIQTQEIELDEAGMAIYRNAEGRPISFESGIRTYLTFIQIYLERVGNQMDFSPLLKLQEDMKKLEGFDEEDLLKAKECAVLCQEIVAKVPLALSRDIITTMRTRVALNSLDTSMIGV